MLLIAGLFLSFALVCDGWKAYPANAAMYADQASSVGVDPLKQYEKAPRTYLHSVYKFGWCTHDTIKKNFLRKQVNMTIKTGHDAKYSHYLYLLDSKHTQRYEIQCVVMKMYVPMQFVFYRGRIPMYYCQGQVFVLMLNTIQKLEVHEFFMHIFLGLLAHFELEFYHPPLF